MGRLRIPFYVYSEFVEVGYAYHWIRPPQSVYAIAFNNADGMSYNYNFTIGNWDSSIQLMYGRYKGISTPGGLESMSDLRDFTSMVWSGSQNEWSFRAAYTRAEEIFIDVDFTQVLPLDLIAALQANGLANVASNLEADGDMGFFADFGLKYDSQNWFIETEIARLEVENSFIADSDLWYISSGWRLNDDHTLHLTYEESEGSAKSWIHAPDQIAAAHPLYPAVFGLVESQESKTNRYTLGWRYNFHPSAAFKLEHHTINDKLNSANDRGLITAAISLVF